jgi:hypothetical protein
MGSIHFQIEWNPWLGGYGPQIPILSALYPQLNLLKPPTPPKKKFLGTPVLPTTYQPTNYLSICYLLKEANSSSDDNVELW